MATDNDVTLAAPPRSSSVSPADQQAGKLFFLKGLLPAEAIRAALHWADDDITVCVEAQSLEDVEASSKLKHIAEFGPQQGEASAREMGRLWVNQLSETILSSTGKPVWQSFEHKGVSAWWFLEILFQEPSYLVARRNQALAKAAQSHEIISKTALAKHDTQLPVVPPPIIKKDHNKLKIVIAKLIGSNWLRSGLKRLALKRRVSNQIRLTLQRLFLSKLKPSNVLCLIEHENLRRHMNSQNGTISAVLPYAEDVIEELQSHLNEHCLVLTRRPLGTLIEGWGFLGSALPPLIYQPLPPEFETALQEIAKLAKPVIQDYFTLDHLREVLVFRLAEYDFYLKLLAKVKPKVVFAYNWEGVFRPLTTAALVSGCRVVGVQQALGPYHHALNHRELGYFSKTNPQGFAIPNKVAVWGPAHQQEFRSYDYPTDSIEVTGYARLDKHFYVKNNKQQVRQRVCKLLGLDPNVRYLLFTGQSRVLDTIILRAEHFVGTMKLLCQLAKEFNFRIIIKPWTSDDVSMVEQAAQANPGLIFVAPQNVLVSNADLLSLSDWLVGTFSSVIGEATLAGNACVLLNYPEARYYFDLPHLEHYRPMIPFVDQMDDLEAVLRPLIEDEQQRLAVVNKAQANMNNAFGPCDGQAAHRIAQVVLGELSAHG